MRQWIGATGVLSGCVVAMDGTGGGTLVDEERVVAPFTTMVSAGRVDVEVSASETQAVTVHCPDQRLGDVVTRVHDGELHVDTRPAGPFASGWDACVVEVRTPLLTAVTVDGTGDLTVHDDVGLGFLGVNGAGDAAVEEVDTAFFEGLVQGQGDLRVSGRADAADLAVSGSGRLDARAMQAVDAEVAADGAGDVLLDASGAVSVALSGSGDVRIWGDASVSIDDHGSGDVYFPR